MGAKIQAVLIFIGEDKGIGSLAQSLLARVCRTRSPLPTSVAPPSLSAIVSREMGASLRQDGFLERTPESRSMLLDGETLKAPAGSFRGTSSGVVSVGARQVDGGE